MDGWRIRLLGDFQVVGPGGVAVAIKSRKARGVVALLALSRGVAITRDQLSRELWPDVTPSKRRESLRQALLQVKRAFHPVRAIECTKDTCRLVLPDWTCDALAVVEGEAEPVRAALLPDMPERAFEEWRRDIAAFEPVGGWAAAAHSTASLLRWISQTEPARALDLLYSVRELMPSLPLNLLDEAITSALADDPNHKYASWGEVQLAILQVWQGRTSKGLALVKAALRRADPTEKESEWATVAFAGAMSLIFSGRFDKAEALLAAAMSTARQLGLPSSAKRLQHALAHCHGYRGDLSSATRILRELAEVEVDLGSLAYLRAHLSIYEVLDNEPRAARENLRGAQRLAANLSDTRLESQLLIAEAYILIAEGEEAMARPILGRVMELCGEFGVPLVMIHTVEAYALISSDPEVRKGHLRVAAGMRERHRLPLLPLDRMRLSRVLPRDNSR